ncbi:MmgE/PrpD family protein [Caballeronia sp. ATUFL_M2_KS44]|uniref:MmgE/PrpD family protein n=1 Tax=Caballeronia sp. ATUFL_M2_KS44 TaxID=2921767 RepID=UPI002028EBB3|nr:MmgE/PrpD family protein [Caballeronia sp. ATUFL_M2_KS44]
MEGLTRQIGRFAAEFDIANVPDVSLKGAQSGIADCVGVMIAGSKEPAPGIIQSTCIDVESERGASVVPSRRWLAPADAALVNGVSAHVLDYDDVALAGHPSSVLVPAILAQGWASKRSGEDVLAAYIAGYETWALLDDLEPGHFHDLGFHPTAVLGTIATTVACAYLQRLTAEQATHAVALSASLASGLVGNFGSMTKSLHAGRAAQSGVLAATWAKAGYTASVDAIEHRTGFMHTHSPSRVPDLAAREHRLGHDWRMPGYGINIKRYPICYATHRAIDAAIGLREAHAVTADAVAEVRVHTGETQRLMLRNRAPQTGLEAKFSMEFAMASALLAGRVGLRELTDAFVARADVQELMTRVRVTTTKELATQWDQPFAPVDEVTFVLRDGRELTADPVARPKGSWQRPLTRDELRAKFVDCARDVLGDGAGSLFDQLSNLRALGSVRELDLFSAALA